MNAVPENPLTLLDGWSLSEKRRMWAALTREMVAANPGGVTAVNDDADRPVAYVLPAHDPTTEYGSDWTVGYLLELQRRAATADDSAPWSDVRGRLASGLGLENPG
jgi:hypothetical protein